MSGITLIGGEPDVFESSDLPEDDQDARFRGHNDLSSESVEPIDICIQSSHDKFKGKFLQTSDFQDNCGYKLSSSNDDSKERLQETLQQTYDRLQFEVKEFLSTLETASSETQEPKNNVVDMSTKAKLLVTQLQNVNIETTMKNAAGVGLTYPEGVDAKNILNKVESLKDDLTKTTDKKQENGLVYELYYKPESAKFLHLTKVSRLEARISALEKLIGHDTRKISQLAKALPIASDSSLVEIVAQLSQRAQLLDSTFVDSCEGRLHSVITKLDAIAQKKKEGKPLNEELTADVNEVFNTVVQWEKLSVCFPDIVNRLTALEALHQQSLQFTQALSHLDAVQQQISQLLRNNSTALGQMRETLNQNVETINKNIAEFDERLKSLKK